MSKYFYFQVVNVFLAITIMGSVFGIVDQAKDLLSSPLTLVTLFANAIPPQSNFFINYVLINSFTSFTLLLWRPAAVIVRKIMLKFLVKTKRDLNKINEPPEYLLSVFYAQSLLFFLLILVYSTLAPLILPFGAVYFIMANATMRYHLIYVVKNKFEGGGNLWESAVQRVCGALLLYQFVVGAVLLGYKFVPGAVIVWVTCVVTLVFWHEMNKRFARCVKACPLEECKESEEKIMGEYKNPALEPLEHSIEKEAAPSV